MARRSLVLATVACRGILELDESEPGPERFWSRVSEWWSTQPLLCSLEPGEAVLLAAPFRGAPRQACIDASWRAEALVVLAWALGRHAVPACDVQVDPAAVAASLGFLQRSTVLDGPSLRPPGELDAYRDVSFTVHWRLVEYSLRPRPMDFRSFCETTSWFGPLSLEGVPLADGDLAIGGHPLAEADSHAVRMAASIARERHLAANWLRSAELPFGETECDT